MTGVEVTYLKLAAISFQVGGNNSLIFFGNLNIQEEVCLVSFPVERIYNSLLKARNYRLTETETQQFFLVCL